VSAPVRTVAALMSAAQQAIVITTDVDLDSFTPN